MPIIISSAELPWYRSRLVMRRVFISMCVIGYVGAIGLMTIKIVDGFKPVPVKVIVVPEVKPEVKEIQKGDKDGNIKTKSKRS